MQIELSANCTPAPLLVLQPPTQADRRELMKPSPTASESGRTLQKGTNRPCIEPEFLTSFLQMRIIFCNLLSSMSNLRYVLEDLGAVNHEHASVDDLPHTMGGFGRCTQKG